jgi:TrpR-related protein YerC/YecD
MQQDWKTADMKDLAKAFMVLKNEEEVLAFLRDVCTITELKEMAGRFAAVKLLNTGESIRSVAEKTGLSTTTVSRVGQWKNQIGEGGYNIVLSRIEK